MPRPFTHLGGPGASGPRPPEASKNKPAVPGARSSSGSFAHFPFDDLGELAAKGRVAQAIGGVVGEAFGEVVGNAWLAAARRDDGAAVAVEFQASGVGAFRRAISTPFK